MAIMRLTVQELPRLEVRVVVMTLFRERFINVIGLLPLTLVRPTVLLITWKSLVPSCWPVPESTSLRPRLYLNGELLRLLAFGTRTS